MNDSVLKLMGTTEQLARSVDHLERDYRELLNNTSNYQQDIQHLRDQLEATNAKINALK